ncbi:MAG: hypothetical protein QOE30_401 [Mycobacterium sp.]|nr:hypothetical protein [Mycobacterium sp.]
MTLRSVRAGPRWSPFERPPAGTSPVGAYGFGGVARRQAGSGDGPHRDLPGVGPACGNRRRSSFRLGPRRSVDVSYRDGLG